MTCKPLSYLAHRERVSFSEKRAVYCFSTIDYLHMTLLCSSIVAVVSGLLGHYVYGVSDIVVTSLWVVGGLVGTFTLISWIASVFCRYCHSHTKKTSPMQVASSDSRRADTRSQSNPYIQTSSEPISLHMGSDAAPQAFTTQFAPTLFSKSQVNSADNGSNPLKTAAPMIEIQTVSISISVPTSQGDSRVEILTSNSTPIHAALKSSISGPLSAQPINTQIVKPMPRATKFVKSD